MKIRNKISKAYERVKGHDDYFLSWRDEVPTIRAGLAELQRRGLEPPKELRSEQWAELQAEYDHALATMPKGWKPSRKKAKAASRPMTFREMDEARFFRPSGRNED